MLFYIISNIRELLNVAYDIEGAKLFFMLNQLLMGKHYANHSH
jgi:hypothetical protein